MPSAATAIRSYECPGVVEVVASRIFYAFYLLKYDDIRLCWTRAQISLNVASLH